MAKARMLAKSISLSRKVNRLKLKSALIYTWGFAHTDDWGLISNDPEVIKATVLPMRKDIRVSDIVAFIEEAQVKDVNGESLITEWQECLEFNAFEDHQTLNPEKRAKPKFQKVKKVIPEIPKNPQETPEKPLIREEKGIEGKGKEVADKSAHKDFIDWYSKTCMASRNIRVKITAAGAKNLKSALKEQPFEELQKRAVYFLGHIAFKTFSPGVETFLSAGVQNGIANRSKNDENYWKDLERLSAKYIAPQIDRLTAVKIAAATATKLPTTS